jgi:hypothetical protein
MTKYFVDENGNYLGGFYGAEPPIGFVEVPTAPQSAFDKWINGGWIPTPAIPQSIPALNGRIAMIQAGWMPAVRAVLDAMEGIEGEIAREYFNNSLTYERNHPLVQAVPAVIGKTQDEVDALFIQAGAMHV